MNADENKILTEKAKEIRALTIDEIGFCGFGHIGGSMSIIEILVLLHHKHMDVTPANFDTRDREMLVVSKGHAGPALYSVLADKGFFPKEWLHTLNKGGTNLPSHCDRLKTPGIDMTAGALGQGLSVAVGMALGNRLDKIDKYVYAIIGDGESNEGQVWEAGMSAAQWKLSNLIAFTDYNKLQLDGFMDEVMDISDITSKWISFGWHVQRVNGHDFEEMDRAILNAKARKDQPSMIILDTIKAKGVAGAEGEVTSHHMNIDYETAKEKIANLGD
jgi:transketolase